MELNKHCKYLSDDDKWTLANAGHILLKVEPYMRYYLKAFLDIAGKRYENNNMWTVEFTFNQMLDKGIIIRNMLADKGKLNEKDAQDFINSNYVEELSKTSSI